MPQVIAPCEGARSRGVALEHGLLRTPAPVWLNQRQPMTRDYRASIRDSNNASLLQCQPDNRLDPKKWQGNGFKGNYQFITYFGREQIRGGEKLDRDVQCAQAPKENAKPLNTTQMGRSSHMVATSSMPSETAMRAHTQALSTIRNGCRVAESLERTVNPHSSFGNPMHDSHHRQLHIGSIHEAIKDVRNAGVASLNPTLGTAGSLPDLSRTRGASGMDNWRHCTPWAIDHRSNRTIPSDNAPF